VTFLIRNGKYFQKSPMSEVIGGSEWIYFLRMRKKRMLFTGKDNLLEAREELKKK